MTETDARIARDIAIDELKTTNKYSRLEEQADSEKAKKVIHDITREEKVHTGEAAKLLDDADPEAREAMEEGVREAKAMKSFREVYGARRQAVLDKANGHIEKDANWKHAGPEAVEYMEQKKLPNTEFLRTTGHPMGDIDEYRKKVGPMEDVNDSRNKPINAIYGSKYTPNGDYDSPWKEFTETEDFMDKDTGEIYTVHPDSRVLVLHNPQEYRDFLNRYPLGDPVSDEEALRILAEEGFGPDTPDEMKKVLMDMVQTKHPSYVRAAQDYDHIYFPDPKGSGIQDWHDTSSPILDVNSLITLNDYLSDGKTPTRVLRRPYTPREQRIAQGQQDDSRRDYVPEKDVSLGFMAEGGREPGAEPAPAPAPAPAKVNDATQDLNSIRAQNKAPANKEVKVGHAGAEEGKGLVQTKGGKTNLKDTETKEGSGEATEEAQANRNALPQGRIKDYGSRNEIRERKHIAEGNKVMDRKLKEANSKPAPAPGKGIRTGNIATSGNMVPLYAQKWLRQKEFNDAGLGEEAREAQKKEDRQKAKNARGQAKRRERGSKKQNEKNAAEELARNRPDLNVKRATRAKKASASAAPTAAIQKGGKSNPNAAFNEKAKQNDKKYGIRSGGKLGTAAAFDSFDRGADSRPYRPLRMLSIAQLVDDPADLDEIAYDAHNSADKEKLPTGTGIFSNETWRSIGGTFQVHPIRRMVKDATGNPIIERKVEPIYERDEKGRVQYEEVEDVDENGNRTGKTHMEAIYKRDKYGNIMTKTVLEPKMEVAFNLILTQKGKNRAASQKLIGTIRTEWDPDANSGVQGIQGAYVPVGIEVNGKGDIRPKDENGTFGIETFGGEPLMNRQEGYAQPVASNAASSPSAEQPKVPDEVPTDELGRPIMSESQYQYIKYMENRGKLPPSNNKFEAPRGGGADTRGLNAALEDSSLPESETRTHDNPDEATSGWELDPDSDTNIWGNVTDEAALPPMFQSMRGMAGIREMETSGLEQMIWKQYMDNARIEVYDQMLSAGKIRSFDKMTPQEKAEFDNLAFQRAKEQRAKDMAVNNAAIDEANDPAVQQLMDEADRLTYERVEAWRQQHPEMKEVPSREMPGLNDFVYTRQVRLNDGSVINKMERVPAAKFIKWMDMTNEVLLEQERIAHHQMLKKKAEDSVKHERYLLDCRESLFKVNYPKAEKMYLEKNGYPLDTELPPEVKRGIADSLSGMINEMPEEEMVGRAEQIDPSIEGSPAYMAEARAKALKDDQSIWFDEYGGKDLSGMDMDRLGARTAAGRKYLANIGSQVSALNDEAQGVARTVALREGANRVLDKLAQGDEDFTGTRDLAESIDNNNSWIDDSGLQFASKEGADDSRARVDRMLSLLDGGDSEMVGPDENGYTYTGLTDLDKIKEYSRQNRLNPNVVLSNALKQANRIKRYKVGEAGGIPMASAIELNKKYGELERNGRLPTRKIDEQDIVNRVTQQALWGVYKEELQQLMDDPDLKERVQNELIDDINRQVKAKYGPNMNATPQFIKKVMNEPMDIGTGKNPTGGSGKLPRFTALLQKAALEMLIARKTDEAKESEWMDDLKGVLQSNTETVVERKKKDELMAKDKDAKFMEAIKAPGFYRKTMDYLTRVQGRSQEDALAITRAIYDQNNGGIPKMGKAPNVVTEQQRAKENEANVPNSQKKDVEGLEPMKLVDKDKPKMEDMTAQEVLDLAKKDPEVLELLIKELKEPTQPGAEKPFNGLQLARMQLSTDQTLQDSYANLFEGRYTFDNNGGELRREESHNPNGKKFTYRNSAEFGPKGGQVQQPSRLDDSVYSAKPEKSPTSYNPDAKGETKEEPPKTEDTPKTESGKKKGRPRRKTTVGSSSDSDDGKTEPEKKSASFRDMFNEKRSAVIRKYQGL